MKRLFTLFACVIMLASLSAQTPKSFKYQAVARDSNGDPIVNQSVAFRFSILAYSPVGAVVYQETQTATTNDFGLVSMSIGSGSVISGDIETIDWELGSFYLKTEMDPAGGSSYQDLGASEIESVPFALYDGDWYIYNDDLILSVPGNVSIGSGVPTAKLQVQNSFPSTSTVEDILDLRRASTGTVADGMGAGLIFRNEVSNGAFALSGRIASIMESATSPGASAGMLLQTRTTSGNMNNAVYIDPTGYMGLNNTDPLYRLDIDGDLNVAYPGSLNAMRVVANSQLAAAYIENSYAGDTWGLSAGVTSTSAGSSSYGVYGFNYGSGSGVYGINYSSGNGVYGTNSSSNNYGYLGGQFYSVYGDHSSGNYGYIGSDGYGVFANLNTTNAGNYAIYGNGISNSGANGTSYTSYGSLGGVKGYNIWGNPYNFAVGGFTYLDYDRAGGTIGANNSGSVWGALSYQRSGSTEYGGFFTSYTSGSGKTSNVYINNGIGAYGELFGADIHGKIYGAFIEGENYATYTKGTSFHDGLDVHIQENGSPENTVLYTSVSTDATVQTSGYATLSSGKAAISFDPRFAAAVSDSEPIIVTVTPMGDSKGVYLQEVNHTGFTIAENENGKSQVTVSYIAVGKRKGFENPELPQEVIAADYTTKLQQGLHNDADTENNGQGLYYENGTLNVGVHSSTIPKPEGRLAGKSENTQQFEPQKPLPGNGKAEAKEE